jgi:hypothetical protein
MPGILSGAIATPAFFTVAAVARALGLDLSKPAVAVSEDQRPATGRVA